MVLSAWPSSWAALGLILPAVTEDPPRVWCRWRRLGLVLVCVGGATYQVAAGELGNAMFALVLGLICAFVAVGRWLLVPHRGKSQPRLLELAR